MFADIDGVKFKYRAIVKVKAKVKIEVTAKVISGPSFVSFNNISASICLKRLKFVPMSQTCHMEKKRSMLCNYNHIKEYFGQ